MYQGCLPLLGVEAGSKYNVPLDHVGGSLHLGMQSWLSSDTSRIAHLPTGFIQTLDAADYDPFLHIRQAGNFSKWLVREGAKGRQQGYRELGCTYS